ncbi:MAG: sodium/proton-translocating pyrophosphatase, partial [Actinobacteria bacterium]|nr:sodium/proton-translocating pyrophosphatase [Actinomycetota bacterium]
MDFIKDAVYFVPLLGVIGLLTILAIYIFISRQNPGNETMVEIANQIREGAMTYMRRQLLNVGVFVVIIVTLLTIFLKDPN